MDVASEQAASQTVDAALTIERLVEGPITCLRLGGIINETFDGRRLAAGIKAQTLIFDFAEVKRISSFGIREWSDFVEAVERNVQRIIAIELPPKMVDQLNMVAHFLGAKGTVFSFYAPYRCDYCDHDTRVLLQVDRDRAAIVSDNPPERTCESCSRPEYFDEDAGAFFRFIAGQPAFELPPLVADFLASKLRYSVTGTERRLQIDKYVEGRSTYLKLVGNLDGSFPSSKIAEGLEGTLVVDVSAVGTIDLAGAAEWRNFVTLSQKVVTRTLVLGCPPIFLERLKRQGDLGDVVVSFSMPYSCARCATTSSQTIDVSEHYELLKFATPPEMKCAQCKQPAVCSAPESLLSRLRTLPMPDLDPGIKKFIREARERKPPRPVAATTQSEAIAPRLGLLMSLVLVLVVGAAGLMLLVYLKQREQTLAAPREAVSAPVEIRRPDWITSDTPLFAYCSDLVNRLSCVGVSSYVATREIGQAEASHAALEAMTNSIGLRIADATFEQKVRLRFDAARTDALTALEKHLPEPQSGAYQAAVERVRDGRMRVSQSFRLTGGSAAPGQQATWFWEEYEHGKEFLVFVRFDVDADAVRRLIDAYTTQVAIGGARVITAYPQLAWKLSGTIEGADVVDPGPLAARGVAAGDVIVAIDGKPVRNAAEVAARFAADASRPPPLTIVAVDGQRRDIP